MLAVTAASLSGGPDPRLAAPLVVVLALAHALGGRGEVAAATSVRHWLSAGGGAAVAYVFVLVLPEVSDVALVVGERLGEAFLAEQLAYLVVLTGFVAFYGVEVTVAHRCGGDAESSAIVYRAHLAVFTVYSALVGYLLFHQERPGPANYVFYTVAMGLHFVVTDEGFHRHHGDAFDHRGRYLLVAGTLVGGVVGALTEIGPLHLALVFAFVAGSVVLNVLKEELPEAGQSRFLAFLGGAAVYAALVLLV
ncbi:hypothetical protein [Halorientalis pallida]|uniref:ZIP Zinc transporter n=1 Tax=Halorientalis pallida TaxID=2479928 RepID=A0A498L047_9EURY|nr:hypothetical protein [Halorientalis pallida]RXK51427.1 hypothetical protein EAF64_01950 [Halorientalis pallida]